MNYFLFFIFIFRINKKIKISLRKEHDISVFLFFLNTSVPIVILSYWHSSIHSQNIGWRQQLNVAFKFYRFLSLEDNILKLRS